MVFQGFLDFLGVFLPTFYPFRNDYSKWLQISNSLTSPSIMKQVDLVFCQSTSCVLILWFFFARWKGFAKVTLKPKERKRSSDSSTVSPNGCRPQRWRLRPGLELFCCMAPGKHGAYSASPGEFTDLQLLGTKEALSFCAPVTRFFWFRFPFPRC